MSFVQEPNPKSPPSPEAGPARPSLKVFISSPSDVRPERQTAKRLIEKLNREFFHYFEATPVLWEWEPLVATGHFQDSITRPRETDIVVIILWSRIGVSLPEDKFLGAITGKPVTGTEWEFEDAFAASRQSGKPALLVYVKTAEVRVSLEDEAALLQQLDQKKRVKDFIQRWFLDEQTKRFKLAYNAFADTAEFEEMLEAHLRELMERRLNLTADLALGSTIRWHQGSPFRGLESFGLEHAPVFFGRTRARNELRERLAHREEEGNAFVLVVGASGSGKSSLVKAGLLADLQLPGMIGRVALCRHAVLRPALSQGDLLGYLAATILSPTALPELTHLLYDRAGLASLMRETPTLFTHAIHQGLQAAAHAQSLTERATARLLVVIDQLEELFTLDSLPVTEKTAFVAALDALARSGLAWVVATLRSDFLDRLEQLPVLEQLCGGEARYFLKLPTPAEIGQIVRQPAREAGLRFEFDRNRGLGLDEELCQAAAKSTSALPLLEFTLDQLWQRRTGNNELTFAAFQELGGLEGALGRRAEEQFAKLPVEVQSALPQVLRALATVSPGSRTMMTARTIKLEDFASGSPQRQLVDAFLSPEARLLLVGDEEEAAGQVRVTHEALLTHWERAKTQLVRDRADLQMRDRLMEAALLWEQAKGKDKVSRLLPEGLPLAEAHDLLQRRRIELDSRLISFIEASTVAVQARSQRQRKRLLALVVVFAVLAVGAGIAALWAVQAKREAQAKTERLEGVLMLVGKGAYIRERKADENHQISELRQENLREIMPTLSPDKLEIYLPYLQVVMHEFEINTPLRQAAFLATIAHESVEMRFFEEVSSGRAYEGRKDLGNTQPGDGERFKGRGMFMFTGRANYARYGKLLDMDFISNPENMAKPEIAILTGADFWFENDLNKFADSGDMVAIRRRVGGGPHGMENVMKYYQRAKKTFGITDPPESTESPTNTTSSPAPSPSPTQ